MYFKPGEVRTVVAVQGPGAIFVCFIQVALVPPLRVLDDIAGLFVVCTAGTLSFIVRAHGGERGHATTLSVPRAGRASSYKYDMDIACFAPIVYGLFLSFEIQQYSAAVLSCFRAQQRWPFFPAALLCSTLIAMPHARRCWPPHGVGLLVVRPCVLRSCPTLSSWRKERPCPTSRSPAAC